MSCGCSDVCLCYIEGGNGVSVTGDGSVGSPYVISPPAEVSFAATNTGGGLSIVGAGSFGHTPDFNLVLDPASPATLSVSGAGLSVDCCASSNFPVDTVAVDTVLDNTFYTVLVESDAAPVEINLPAIHSSGQRYEIKDYGNGGLGFTTTNAVTVNPSGSLIDGDGSVRTFGVNGESMTVVSDGTNWAII